MLFLFKLNLIYTVFFNDGWDGKWSGYNWLYHMVAEALLGSLSVLSSVPPLPTSIQSQRQDQNQAMRQGWVTYGGDGRLPDRLVIAWDYNWDARHGLPRAVAEALFGDGQSKQNVISPLSNRLLSLHRQPDRTRGMDSNDRPRYVDLL